MAKICEHCGATYLESDGYCKNCWKKLPDNEGTIRGIPKCDWEGFIDKNSDRYIKTFTKNENKKVFLKINLAAFFFGFNWMFYRRMYKFAFIHLVITVLFTLLLYGAIYGASKNDMVKYKQLKAMDEAGYFDKQKQEDEESRTIYNEDGIPIAIKASTTISELHKYKIKLQFVPFF